MTANIEDQWPQWVKSDKFIQRLSTLYCRGRNWPEGQHSRDLPKLADYAKANVEDLQVAGAIAFRRFDGQHAAEAQRVVGRRVRLARLMARMEQKAVQRRIGIDFNSTMLYRIENGRDRIPEDKISPLAKLFDCQDEWFYAFHIACPQNDKIVNTPDVDLGRVADGIDLDLKGALKPWAPVWMNPLIVWTILGRMLDLQHTGRPICTSVRPEPSWYNSV
jgi:transcriptional regulator with XRE-family HTH domain